MKVAELFEATSLEVKQAKAIVARWRKEFKARGSSFGPGQINEHGELEHTGRALKIRDDMLDENGELPVKIKNCYAIELWTKDLRSFKNFPEIILNPAARSDAFYTTGANPHLTSLEGFPETRNTEVQLYDFPNIKTFSKCNQYFKGCTDLIIPGKYKGPLLSVLKIASLNAIFQTNPNEPHIKIINWHLQHGRNIVACQEELFQNGLDEYAAL